MVPEWNVDGGAGIPDRNTQNEANINTGVWKYWTENGKLQKEEQYENDKLVKTKEYIEEEKSAFKINDKN